MAFNEQAVRSCLKSLKGTYNYSRTRKSKSREIENTSVLFSLGEIISGGKNTGLE